MIDGILANVPNPARYAFHKILVSRSRSVTDHTKIEKDLQQAAQLIDVLAEDRPGDLALAWEALEHRHDGSARTLRSAMTSFSKRFQGTSAALLSAVPSLQSKLRS